jgi:putative acetyltransferase
MVKQMSRFVIREETADDIAAVFDVESAAFGRPDEARIVDAIRGTSEAVASFVGVEQGRLVAHVFFSGVRIEGAPRVLAAGLGPVAVVPDRQGAGFGSALIRHGIDAIRARFDLLVVLGNPRYYSRFGFEPAHPAGIEYQTPGFERAFQFMPLRGRVEARGRVVYSPAFGS